MIMCLRQPFANFPSQAKDIPVEAITEATQLYQDLLQARLHMPDSLSSHTGVSAVRDPRAG